MSDENTISHILPRTLHGFPVDIMPAATDIAGFELLICKDVHRHEWMIVHRKSLGDVVRFIRAAQRAYQEGNA